MGIKDRLQNPLQDSTDLRLELSFKIFQQILLYFSELRPLPMLIMGKRLRRCKVSHTLHSLTV